MFFSFFQTKNGHCSHKIKIDLHSHLIPAIDDGAKDMEESIHLLKELELLGYKKVITTPHIMVDSYYNTPNIIMDGLENLKKCAKEEGVLLEIEAAAEYYLDDGFLEHLSSGNILTFGDKYILFETSYYAKPLQFDEILFEIITAGYKPVLAHPERYRYIYNNEEEYQSLKDRGVFFQVNINSFGGHYGKDAKIKAEYLSKKGMIDFLGSDIHHINQVETLDKIRKSNFFCTVFKNNTILNNTL